MAVGNTFGATALSSYGGFWISFAIIFTPGFAIETAYAGAGTDFQTCFSFYLFGWVCFPLLTPLQAGHVKLTNTFLVHLHLRHAHVYTQVHCCFLLPLLHAGSRLPDAVARVLLPDRSWWRKCRAQHCRRCLWYPCCVCCLVQRPGWSARAHKLFLLGTLSVALSCRSHSTNQNASRSLSHTSRGPPRAVSREERRPLAMSSDTTPRSRRPSKLEV